MRILFFVILSLFILNNSYSAEVIDCYKLKFIDKLKCKAKNLQTKLNETQSKTKKKISKNAKDLKSKVDKKLKVEN